MISPELLRRYPVFSQLRDQDLKLIAMISEEFKLPAGSKLFEEGDPANYLYLLIEGAVDLSFTSKEEFHPDTEKVFPVGEINPGELFGISAVIEPYVYTASQGVSQDSRIIRIDAAGLRTLMSDDASVGYLLMHQIAKSLMERLTYTRVQLAAAWA
jgi:CRP-like cAMP-binding protein